MVFWGVELKPGKTVPFVPPPEEMKLHLSQLFRVDESSHTEDIASIWRLRNDILLLRVAFGVSFSYIIGWSLTDEGGVSIAFI
eukprot:1195103-Prorocentrum_minimum.AAC.7